MKSARTTVLLDDDAKCRDICFCWSAIFAGALVGLGLGFLLNLFGIAIGLSAYKVVADGSKAFAVGGYLGLILVSAISMYFAGMATGYLARPFCFKRHMATVYGFATWVLVLLVTMIFAVHMGKFVSYSTTHLSNPASVKYVPDSEMASASDPSASANAAATPDATDTSILSTAAYLTFFLFFIGAISSCLGAHCGLTCKRTDGYELK